MQTDELLGGAVIKHETCQCCGKDVSVIYVDDVALMSDFRNNEKGLIKEFNRKCEAGEPFLHDIEIGDYFLEQ